MVHYPQDTRDAVDHVSWDLGREGGREGGRGKSGNIIRCCANRIAVCTHLREAEYGGEIQASHEHEDEYSSKEIGYQSMILQTERQTTCSIFTNTSLHPQAKIKARSHSLQACRSRFSREGR